MGVLIAQAILMRNTVRCACNTRLSNSKRESFIDFIERPGVGYPRSEGSGAKLEIYLGTAAAAKDVLDGLAMLIPPMLPSTNSSEGFLYV